MLLRVIIALYSQFGVAVAATQSYHRLLTTTLRRLLRREARSELNTAAPEQVRSFRISPTAEPQGKIRPMVATSSVAFEGCFTNVVAPDNLFVVHS